MNMLTHYFKSGNIYVVGDVFKIGWHIIAYFARKDIDVIIENFSYLVILFSNFKKCMIHSSDCIFLG